MSLSLSSDVRPGVRGGIAVGVLGVSLLVVAFGLEVHAAQAGQIPAGEPFTVVDGRPVHVVGVVEPGTDETAPTTCAVDSAAGGRTIGIGTRREALEGIRAGRRVRAMEGGPATVLCDRRVAVATGPAVFAYPLAGWAILYPCYVLLAVLGFGYARRQARSDSGLSPVQPGDDESRSELRRFGIDVLLATAHAAAGVASIILGIVGLLAVREGFPAALILLVPAGLLGAGTLLIGRWRRRRPADRNR
jgi:hypothetical protein